MKTLKTMNTNQKNKSKLVRNRLNFLTISVLALMAFTSCDPSDDINDAPISEPTESVTIDLQAENIIFSVDPTSQFAGNATITGTVRNLGDNFRSGVGQQVIRLYERSLGTPTNQPGTEVASLTFTSLDAGETLEVSYTRSWNSSSPAEGEFAPEYILVIDYDPDLFLDGNVNNDDTNSANNRVLVSGHLINGMF